MPPDRLASAAPRPATAAQPGRGQPETRAQPLQCRRAMTHFYFSPNAQVRFIVRICEHGKEEVIEEAQKNACAGRKSDRI